METTWSFSSRLPTSIFSICCFIDSRSLALELQPGLAGGVGQGLDAAVVLEAAPVEDHRLDPLLLGPAGDELADRLGRGHVGSLLLLEVLVHGGRGAQGLARLVVDDLGVDVGLAAEDGQARPPGRARQPAADAGPDPRADVFLGLDAQAALLLRAADARAGGPGLPGLLLQDLAHVADPLLL